MFNFWSQLEEALNDALRNGMVNEDSNTLITFASISIPIWAAKSILDDHKDEEEHLSALLQHIDMLEDYNRLLRKENEELKADALE